MRNALACLGFVCATVVAACGSPIVDAECRAGYSACDGQCVKTSSDSHNCGSCGHSCGAFACSAGKCTQKHVPDAGLDAGMSMEDAGGNQRDTGTAALPDGSTARPDATIGKGGVGAPFLPDGGVHYPDPMVTDAGCPLGQTECGGACVDPRYDPEHCGACGTSCPSDTQYCLMGMCTNFCDDPLKHCGNTCVDEQTDENHCGSCNTVCLSGICNAGVCADVIPGSLVVIGHDLVSAPPPALQSIVGNALFLPRGAVHALVYTAGADSSSISGVNAAFDSTARDEGRQWQPVNADPDNVSQQLRDANVFVIYAQNNATDVQLVALGQKWGQSMTQFLLRGGVVILFDTLSATTKNTGTYHVLEPAGLFQASGRETIKAGTTVYVVGNSDSVANNVTKMYNASTNSVHFSNIMSDGTVVVATQSGDPVVFHRVISP